MRSRRASIFGPMAQRHRLAAVLTATFLLWTIGCHHPLEDSRSTTAHSGSTSATQPAELTQTDPGWRPTAVRMRVFPSTRFVSDSGRPVLEARVEMIDEMGDSVKTSGSWRVELFSGGDARPIREPRKLLYSWQIQATTLAQQQRHYDPVTRAYLFRLQMDQPTDPQQAVTVSVTFTQPGGVTLQAVGTIDPAS